MFSAQMTRVSNKIAAVRTMVQFRPALFDFLPKENEWAGTKVRRLLNHVPDMQEWRVYEHSASINSLYNIFETYVHDILESILVDYQFHTSYMNLPEVLRKRHSSGVGYLLQNRDRTRFNHIDEERLHAELYRCRSGETPYIITPEAIFTHDSNIRADILADLFGRVDYTGARDHFERCALVGSLLDGSEYASFDSLLKEFVDRRNDCCHGEVDEILSSGGLLFYCDMLEIICRSLTNFVTSKQLELHNKAGLLVSIGEVFESYRANVSVSTITLATLHVGQKLGVERGNRISIAEILNIEVDGVSKEKVAVDGSAEIGLETDIKLKRGTKLYSLNRRP